MRSTPWPNDTLRTVKEARVPPRCWPMTTPSKIWIRSFSPSRTFTWTRTVSPDFMAGRSASCCFSMTSIALMILSSVVRCLFGVRDQFAQNFAFLVVQPRCRQQIRPSGQRPCYRLPLPPLPDIGVIPREKHVRNIHRRLVDRPWRILEFRRQLRRPRVMRKIQQPPDERLLLHGLFVANDTRYQPRNGIDYYERGNFAAAQHVIADRQLLVHPRPNPLVDPLVPSAENHEVLLTAQTLR